MRKLLFRLVGLSILLTALLFVFASVAMASPHFMPCCFDPGDIAHNMACCIRNLAGMAQTCCAKYF